MSVPTGVGLAVFAVLVLALLPLRPCRLAALWLLHRALYLALAATVLTCAFFHLFPQTVPDWLEALLEQPLGQLRSDVPAFSTAEGLAGSPWLLLAVLAVALGLPQLLQLASLRGRLVRDRPRPPSAPAAANRPAGRRRGRSGGEAAGPLLVKDVLGD
jgi:hypothetical protein